jgi:Zn-dependent M32 family carboxypeptidase
MCILLGEASVLLNTIIDLIHSSSSSSSSSSKISIYTLKTFRLERIRLGYSVELEKYPKDFEILLSNYEFRTKLYSFDQIFNKIEEILKLCIQKQQENDNENNNNKYYKNHDDDDENFSQKLIQNLMLSEIGQSIINSNNYKYSI